MRCPNCGQPNVRIRGDRWECTWCLDCGFLPTKVRRQQAQAWDTVERETARWAEWKEEAARRTGQLALDAAYAAQKLLPPQEGREDLIWKAVLCQVTMALSHGDLRDVRWVSSPDPGGVRREFYPYREVVYDLEKISGLFGPGKEKKTCLPTFWKEGGLALNHCGEFWTELIAALPPCPRGEEPSFSSGCLYLPWPEKAPWERKYEMERLLDNLCALMAFFAGEEGDAVDVYKNQLLRAFSRQWKNIRGDGENTQKAETAKTPRAPSKPPEAPPPDDGTVFHYCTVRLPYGRRTYAYLTGGLPLKKGDWVEVPFGKDNDVRRAQVCAVMDCTRLVTPWPPEETKTVLRVAEERSSPASAGQKLPPRAKRETKEQPKPIHKPKLEKNVEREARQRLVRVLRQIAAQKADVPTRVPDKPEKKKTIPWKSTLASAVALAFIGGLFYRSYWNSVQWKRKYIGTQETKEEAQQRIEQTYAAAIEQMAAGNYTEAWRGFSALHYRDADALAEFCRYASLYQDAAGYLGGEREIAALTLQYDTQWQTEIEQLSAKIQECMAQDYAAAMQTLSAGNFVAARSQFSKVYGYRDAGRLATYCEFAARYQDKTEYAGGDFELYSLHLEYDTQWQADIDALEARVSRYKEERDKKLAAEAAEKAAAEKAEAERRKNQQTTVRPTTPSTDDRDKPNEIQEEYDSAEDFYADNKDWLKDMDEAEDYFEDGW